MGRHYSRQNGIVSEQFVRASLARALSDIAVLDLKRAGFRVAKNKVRIRFVCDPIESDDAIEKLDTAIAEVMADVPAWVSIEYEIVRPDNDTGDGFHWVDFSP